MSSSTSPSPIEDRITTLTDSIISHILSFLPTKQSAATSILSKRWSPLWLSVLALDFNEQNFAGFAAFRHFVYSVMLLRNITLPILSLRLKCGNSSGFNPHDVNRFILAAVQGGIQNLNLDMLTPTTICFKLPQCILTCNSLTVLKLKRIDIPSSKVNNFPSLKTLHLENVYFYSLDPTFLKRFLHGCPVLEDLHLSIFLRDYECEELNGLLKLVKANINISSWVFPFAWVRNTKFLCANLCSTNRHEIGDNDWVDPSIVPKCLSYELRICSLIAYKGTKCEFEFADYILKNAKALNTMKISASEVDLNIKHQMLMKLSLCPRGSTACKLSFENG
ncbi:hypothetical protein TSUD_173480 [Trifolium subterraneum]|nr:hypothetical protein TSUD_173480 [Trifolium subterraneum]